jgi:iron complex outermembrane recepter protein
MDRGINFYNCRQLMLLGTSVFSVAAVMVSPVYGQDAQISSPPAAARTEAAPSAAPEVEVTEIVVTATRRGESLNKVPLSIAAILPETLAERGIRSSNDLVSVAPGLTLQSVNDGSETLSIRGIVAFGSTPTTSFYIDETPISGLGARTFSPRFFNVERIEVLRGPQGTLYGASSQGGSIRLITNKPNLTKFEGGLQAEGSGTRRGGSNYAIDGALSVPIVQDKLAVRVTGYVERTAGYARSGIAQLSPNIEDYVTGTEADGAPIFGAVAYSGLANVPSRRIGDQDVFGGRAAILFQPIDEIKLTASYQYQERKNDGGSNESVVPALGLREGQLRRVVAFEDSELLRSRIINVTGEGDLGFAKLTSASSWQLDKGRRVADLTPLGFPFLVGLAAAAYTAAGQAVTIPSAGGVSGNQSRVDDRTTAFTQEARLVSSGDGSLNWIIGGFYTNQKRSLLGQGRAPGISAVPGISLLAPQDIFTTDQSQFTQNELSFFGELGYEFNNKLSATVGLRRYRVTTTNNTSTNTLGNVIQPGLLTSRETGLTYKALLSYKPTNDLLFFAGYTTGYRPGGSNDPSPNAENPIPPTFKSDRLAQYELGYKLQLADRRVSLNGAFFFIDWRSIPISLQTRDFFFYTVNGPRARIKGAEVEVKLRPIKGLEAGLNLTLLDAKFRRDFIDPATSTPLRRRGDRLSDIPNITLNANLNYDWAINDNLQARVGGDLVLVSQKLSTVTEFVPPLPAYVSVGLTAGLSFGKVDASFFIRNLFDVRGQVSRFGAPGQIINGTQPLISQISYIQPRTIGASLNYKF